MDLRNTNASELGDALDRLGLSWSLDNDGDICIRFRSLEEGGTDAVFYEFDTVKQDFSITGRFLNGRVTQLPDGSQQWSILRTSGLEPTAIAQKVTTLFFMPRAGRLAFQIHAAIVPLGVAAPINISVIPTDEQLQRIQIVLPGVSVQRGNGELWLTGALSVPHATDESLRSFIQSAAAAGKKMFSDRFTGFMRTGAL